MNHGEMTAVLIVAIVMIASIFRASGSRSLRHRGELATTARRRPKTSACATRSKQLKERLKVLERITVEKENSLSREIDSLRDR